MRLLKNGSTIGKAKVIVDIVAKGNFEIRPGYWMNPSELALHNTGNKGRGANAKAHNTYIHNMAELPASATGYASWHYSVDAYFIYQHIPNNESAWHTGDGDGSKSGNRNALGIEICENSDMTPREYAQAEENAVQLAAYLMKLFSIPILKVKPHQAYSGKYCPRVILNRDGSFYKFNARINKAFKFKPVPSKPTVKPVSKPKEEVMKLTEKAIVINSFIDYPAVQKLHIRTGYPIFERSAVKEKVARELIIAGGGIKGLEKFAERFIDLSGKSREETVKNVTNYMNK